MKLKPGTGNEGLRREIADAPQCWVAFFREVRRIAARKRVQDARNGVRPEPSLKRKATRRTASVTGDQETR